MKLLSTKSMMRYLPPNGTAGLARSLVRGDRRVPLPPANTIPNTRMRIASAKALFFQATSKHARVRPIVWLHIRGNLDTKNTRGAFQLPPEEIGHPQQEHLFLAVLLVNDRVLVIEVVESLRQLKGVLGDVRRFAGSDGALHGGIGFRSRQQHLPEIFALKLARQG